MKKLILLFLLGIGFNQINGQNEKEKLQVKNIVLTAYESVSQADRQWLADVTEKHPPGDFDTGYAKTKLKERFSKQSSGMDELWICMMAYQKMATKEAREDRKIQSQVKRIMLASKAEKIKMDNEAIDKGMQEAKEKAAIAMEAATTSLVTGIVSGLLQISSSASSFSGQDDNTRKKDSIKIKAGVTPVRSKLSLSQYIKKLEGQLASLKKG
jgi:hypothetical protein